MTCANKVIIEEIDSKNSKINDFVNFLMKTKFFNEFFDWIEFKEEGRKEATNAIINIAQKYKPMCCMVTHLIKQLAKVSQNFIIFTEKDFQAAHYGHNGPLCWSKSQWGIREKGSSW